ncbi:MAG: chemotaxis protein CheB [Pararhodobacter sp.]
MPQHRVLIADDRPIRLRRLAPQIAADSSIELLEPVRTLTDAYNLTELHQPDVAFICEEMAVQPEFLMYRALLVALGLRCVIFGSRHNVSEKLEFVTVDETYDAHEILRALGRSARSSRPGLASVRSAASASIGATVAPFSRCVVIGASTGGIEALLSVLSAFPADCPPTLIVQHIRAEFAAGFIQRLNRNCLATVSEARDGAPLVPGQIYVAPDDIRHLVIRGTRSPRCKLVHGEPVSGHRPSVDMLFHSAAQLGPAVVGVLLTGMGRDGAEGLLEIRRNGGRTIAQDRASCTVHGMPRAAVELGAAMQELPLNRIGNAVLMACRDNNALAG